MRQRWRRGLREEDEVRRQQQQRIRIEAAVAEEERSMTERPRVAKSVQS